MGSDGCCSLWQRLCVGVGLLFGLRGHDFRAGRSYMNMAYGQHAWPVRILRMCSWTLGQVFGTIPEALRSVTFAERVSKTPIWLAGVPSF